MDGHAWTNGGYESSDYVNLWGERERDKDKKFLLKQVPLKSYIITLTYLPLIQT